MVIIISALGIIFDMLFERLRARLVAWSDSAQDTPLSFT
jgi:NitT/TauT family transport system permease protein